MHSPRRILIILYLILCLAILYAVNEDIFKFSDTYFINHKFDPSVYQKSDYLLQPRLTLRKGSYWVAFQVNANGTGNGYYIVNQTGEVLVRDEFRPEIHTEIFQLKIDKPSEQVRFGISFDPAGERLDVLELFVTSDFVISRDSILRHFVTTLFLTTIFLLIGWRIFSPASWFGRFGQLSSPVNERILVVLLGVSAVTSFPFFYNKFYLQTDDYMFHLLRIEGIKVGLENGIFPVRVNPYFLHGFGYGDGLFYPSLTLVFPAVLRILGFDPTTVFKIFVILLNFLSIGCFYLVTWKISKSRYSGLMGAIFYAFASYRLIDILFRCGFGEAQSFLFTPVIILGLYEIFSGRPEKWYIFAAGFLGLACTHLLSLVLAICFVGVFCLFRIRRILSDRSVLMALVKSVLLVLGLSAFFFLPMAEQVLTSASKANLLVSTSLDLENFMHGIIPGSHLLTPIPSWYPVVDPNLGLPFIILPFAFFMVKKSDPCPMKRLAILCLIAGCVAAFISTEWFPWGLAAWIGNRLQFAWRVLLIAVPLLSMAGGLISESIFDRNQKKLAILGLAALSMVSTAPMFFNATRLRLETRYPLHLNSVDIIGGEYMPVGSDLDFILDNGDTVLSNDPELTILKHDRRPLYFSFEFETTSSPENGLQFEIPLLFYTGYVAEFEAPGAAPVELKPRLGEHGFVAVDIPNVAKGRVTAFYRTTLVQRLGDFITILTLAGCIGFGIRRWRMKRNGLNAVST